MVMTMGMRAVVSSCSVSAAATTRTIPVFHPRFLHSESPSYVRFLYYKPPISISANGFLTAASRNRGRRSKNGAGALDFADEFDEEGEDWGDEEEEEEEEDVEEGDDVMPFEKMRRWMRNKPSGFGEGKVYDISLEEELWEEIERCRKAQIANVNKLKSGKESEVGKATKKREQNQQVKEIEIAPSGVRVRIGNLPRKRNISRDLQAAFKGFHGIKSINPAVTGNKKTRDPVCKGFAFLDFESEEVANRFVKAYSRQPLPFGNVQKQISCQIINSSNSDLETLSDESRYEEDITIGKPEVLAVSEEPQSSSSHLLHKEMHIENSEMNILNSGERQGSGNEVILATANSSSSNQMRREQVVNSKRKVKKIKPQKPLKPNTPGSANRLKLKERDVFTNVFSKYGGTRATVAT